MEHARKCQCGAETGRSLLLGWWEAEGGVIRGGGCVCRGTKIARRRETESVISLQSSGSVGVLPRIQTAAGEAK